MVKDCKNDPLYAPFQILTLVSKQSVTKIAPVALILDKDDGSLSFDAFVILFLFFALMLAR